MTSDNTEDLIPDELSSPLINAQRAMRDKLKWFHDEIFTERESSHFETAFFNPNLKNLNRSDKELHDWIREARELNNDTNGKPLKQFHKGVVNTFTTYVLACTFLMKSILVRGRSTDEAWEYVVDSNYYFGMLKGRMQVNPAYSLAIYNSDIRHKENRAMKAEVFLWLDSNRQKFKSMDATAEAVTKQQPIAFRTARDWVGEWKKLRSASTP